MGDGGQPGMVVGGLHAEDDAGAEITSSAPTRYRVLMNAVVRQAAEMDRYWLSCSLAVADDLNGFTSTARAQPGSR